MEKRNIHLRNAFVQKLKFSPQKNVKDKIDNRKSNITPDFEFDEIDNDELVSACVTWSLLSPVQLRKARVEF